jgi:hypothetical protein
MRVGEKEKEKVTEGINLIREQHVHVGNTIVKLLSTINMHLENEEQM